MFKQKNDSPAPPAGVEPTDPVQQARRRARQRLIGAIVLLGIGIIGFPLVFETQPRPVPVDIPIEIPKKDNAPALVMPAARPTVAPADAKASATAATALPRTTAAASQPATKPGSDMITESREDAGREVAAAPRAASQAAADAEKAATATAAKATEKAAEKAAEKQKAAERAAEKAAEKAATKTAEMAAGKAEEKSPVATSADGARAQALLEGRTDASAPRFVVQVGAFAEATAAREARQRVERLGLKTYTQVAQTPSGSRIRVRVGPFATREEAEGALAKAKAAGLTAVVLTL